MPEGNCGSSAPIAQGNLEFGGVSPVKLVQSSDFGVLQGFKGMVTQELDYAFDSLSQVCEDNHRIGVLDIRGVGRVKVRVGVIIWRIIRRITSRDIWYS